MGSTFHPIPTANTSGLPVTEQRISQVIREARGETPVGSREPEKLAADRLLAEKLIPFINRKTVKQTVMTSVYGVTFVGARQQIQNRLQESKFDEDLLYDASIYLAKLTLSSIGKKFVGADKVKEWLADCAQAIAGTGQDVAWINPLGLFLSSLSLSYSFSDSLSSRSQE